MGVQAQRASEVQMNLAHNVLVIGLLSSSGVAFPSSIDTRQEPCGRRQEGLGGHCQTKPAVRVQAVNSRRR